jgi:hypothetical protein
MVKCVVGATAALALAAGACAQVRVETSPSGTFLVSVPRGEVGIPGAMPDALLWTYNHPVAIAESVAVSQASQSAWVGQTLNAERIQRFPIAGPGTPTFEATGGGNSPAVVASAKGADLAVFLDRPDAPAPGTLFQVRAYNAAGGPALWTREFPDIYDGYGGIYNIKVSRDGSTVAVALNQGFAASNVWFLNGADGTIRQTWPGETGTVGSVDLSDNGSLAFIQHTTNNAFGRVIDTGTGLETFSAVGSGSGSRYQMSGNGDVLVMGGFSFYVFKRVGTSYNQIINTSLPTSWFGWGSSVSRDGSTVGVITHNYGDGYLTNVVQAYDVATASLIFSSSTTGSGTFQSSAVGSALSDDGSRLATAAWGAQEGTAEVKVFNRTGTMIDSLDSAGSPFAIDMTGNGQYVLIGSKSVHANTFGNGGNTYVLDLGGGSGGCYANCDGSTTTPVLNVADFTCFLQRYAAGESYANCDGSTTTPVLNVADFTCFLQRYAAGESYANCDGSTTAPVLNVADFTCFLQSYAAGCP